jgi:hypothetical protein
MGRPVLPEVGVPLSLPPCFVVRDSVHRVMVASAVIAAVEVQGLYVDQQTMDRPTMAVCASC